MNSCIKCVKLVLKVSSINVYTIKTSKSRTEHSRISFYQTFSQNISSIAICEVASIDVWPSKLLAISSWAIPSVVKSTPDHYPTNQNRPRYSKQCFTNQVGKSRPCLATCTTSHPFSCPDSGESNQFPPLGKWWRRRKQVTYCPLGIFS